MTKHRSAASLLISGMATLTLDQRLRMPKMKNSRDALAGDWQAIGGDLRRALGRGASERDAG